MTEKYQHKINFFLNRIVMVNHVKLNLSMKFSPHLFYCFNVGKYRPTILWNHRDGNRSSQPHHSSTTCIEWNYKKKNLWHNAKISSSKAKWVEYFLLHFPHRHFLDSSQRHCKYSISQSYDKH